MISCQHFIFSDSRLCGIHCLPLKSHWGILIFLTAQRTHCLCFWLPQGVARGSRNITACSQTPSHHLSRRSVAGVSWSLSRCSSAACDVKRPWQVVASLPRRFHLFGMVRWASNAIPSQAEEQQQQQPKFQKMLQPVYRDWGIPWSEDKSLSRRTKVVRLGAELDGDVGTLGVAGEKRMESFSLAFYLLGQERVTKKGVQVFLSAWCTCLNSEGLLFLLCKRFGRECFASHRPIGGPLSKHERREMSWFWVYFRLADPLPDTITRPFWSVTCSFRVSRWDSFSDFLNAWKAAKKRADSQIDTPKWATQKWDKHESKDHSKDQVKKVIEQYWRAGAELATPKRPRGWVHTSEPAAPHLRTERRPRQLFDIGSTSCFDFRPPFKPCTNNQVTKQPRSPIHNGHPCTREGLLAPPNPLVHWWLRQQQKLQQFSPLQVCVLLLCSSVPNATCFFKVSRNNSGISMQYVHLLLIYLDCIRHQNARSKR